MLRRLVDEVQRGPELLLAIKRNVDTDQRPGRFLLENIRTSIPTACLLSVVRRELPAWGFVVPITEAHMDSIFTAAAGSPSDWWRSASLTPRDRIHSPSPLPSSTGTTSSPSLGATEIRVASSDLLNKVAPSACQGTLRPYSTHRLVSRSEHAAREGRIGANTAQS